MKTKEELNELKSEVESLNKKLAELTEDELKQVNGGLAFIKMVCRNPNCNYVIFWTGCDGWGPFECSKCGQKTLYRD